MLAAADIKRILLENLPMLQKKYPIGSLSLFGSYARGDNTPESDIDILVELNGPIGLEFIQIAYDLEALLGNRVDLVSRRAINARYWPYIEEDLIPVS